MRRWVKPFFTGWILLVVACEMLLASPEGSSHALRLVTPAHPAAPIRFAAQELTRYLAAMGNSKPEVAEQTADGDLYLGCLPKGLSPRERKEIEASLRGKDSDSFMIRSVGQQLIIYGNTPRATLYGGYHYLETLGVRWYFPGRANEVIPHASPRLEGYSITEVPSFRKRGFVVFPTTNDLDDMVDFAAKKKLNTIGLHTWFDPKFSNLRLPDVARMAAPRGLDVQIERHFFGENFCPDDTRGLEQARKDLLEFVAMMPPSMNEFFLWPADRFLAPCSSPQYRDYSVSDLILWFDNQMLKTLRQSRPNARFAFLSYLSTWAPPQHEKPLPGLTLEWAPIFQSLAFSLDDPASSANAEYRMDFEALLKMFGPANSQVLGYWLDDTMALGNGFGKLGYHPDALRGDLAYYHRMGVPAVTTFGVITGHDYFLSHVSPAVFLYPTLLWNVQADPATIVRDFCVNYMGSEQAAEVFELLAQADRMVYIEHAQIRGDKANDPEFMEKVSQALRLAQALLDAEKDPIKRPRVAKLIQEVASRIVAPRSQVP